MSEIRKIGFEIQVRDPTTWAIIQHDGPDHLGLWCNAAPLSKTMALITSGCVRQTREYRAPEVLLGSTWDVTVDVW